MQPIQWSEISSRLRRLTRTVGQQTAVLEEVVSPQITLGDVGGAPYRSEPRRCAASLSSAPAAAGSPPLIGCAFDNTVAPASDGAFVLRRVTWAARARPDNNQIVRVQLLAVLTAGNFGGNPGFYSMEPVTGQAGALGQVGPVLFASSQATMTTLRVLDEQVIATNASTDPNPCSGIFDNLMAVILPAKLNGLLQLGIAVSIDGTSGAAVNNLGCTGSFLGDYYNNYPLR